MNVSTHYLSLTALAIAAIANAAGYLFNLYELTGFDEVLHGYTLFAMTLAVADFAYDKVFIGRRSHPVLLFFALTFVGVGMGGVWEMFEWVFDAMTVANSIKGKYDTMLDLVVDTAGAAVAAIMYIALHWGTD